MTSYVSIKSYNITRYTQYITEIYNISYIFLMYIASVVPLSPELVANIEITFADLQTTDFKCDIVT